EAFAPEVVEAADRVAVTVDQHRDEARILEAFGYEQRRRSPCRVVEYAALEAERRQRGFKFLVEIGAQRLGAIRFLARARNGDAPPQIIEERAVVEIGVRACDGGSPAHGVSPRRSNESALTGRPAANHVCLKIGKITRRSQAT